MNMQSAVAALASLNHSQSSASVAQAGGAKALAQNNATGAQGFGALLQMLMGTSVQGDVGSCGTQISQDQFSELGAQLVQVMQMLESDPELAKLAKAGETIQLGSLLEQKGLDLKELDSDLQDIIGTDVLSFVTELMPRMDSSALLDTLSLEFQDGVSPKDQLIDARVSSVSLNDYRLESDEISSKGLDAKLEDLIGLKIKELSSGGNVKVANQETLSSSSLASAMNNGELSAKQNKNSSNSADNENLDLLLSQKGIELKQKLSLKAGASVGEELAQVLPKDEMSAKLSLGNGNFSNSIKQATESVIAKVSSANSGRTSNIDLALGQSSNAATQVHFDAKGSGAETISTLPRTQFSVIRDTVDQVQGLAKDMAMQIKAGESEIRIAIKPEHLGEMMVKVSIESSGINLDMKVENAEVKQVFDASLQQLRDNLAQNGIKVNNANVDIQQQDMSQQNRSRFFHERRGVNKRDKDGFEFDTGVEDVASRSADLQSRVYAQAAYGVNYLA